MDWVVSTMTVELHRAGSRARTATGWLDSRHSFSFGRHYDAGNTHFGLLLVSNHDVVQPGTGFETHPHRDMEIVTWVLGGGLVHQDSLGHAGLIHPGLAQRMSAGTGVLHSEKHDRVTAEPVEFVQMWVVPDESSREPGYQQQDVSAELAAGGLVTVASGRDAHRDARAIAMGNRFAALHVARLAPGQSVQLPSAAYSHIYLARGSADLEAAGALNPGDAARVTGAEGQQLTARSDCEVLVWEMHADLGAR